MELNVWIFNKKSDFWKVEEWVDTKHFWSGHILWWKNEDFAVKTKMVGIKTKPNEVAFCFHILKMKTNLLIQAWNLL